MLGKFDSLVFFIEDIHEASRWYAEFLNTEVQYENDKYAFISFAGGKFGFHPKDTESGGEAGSPTAYWCVDRLGDAINKFQSRGAKLSRGPLKTTLNEHACIICDPFGNNIGLISKNA